MVSLFGWVQLSDSAGGESFGGGDFGGGAEFWEGEGRQALILN